MSEALLDERLRRALGKEQGQQGLQVVAGHLGPNRVAEGFPQLQGAVQVGASGPSVPQAQETDAQLVLCIRFEGAHAQLTRCPQDPAQDLEPGAPPPAQGQRALDRERTLTDSRKADVGRKDHMRRLLEHAGARQTCGGQDDRIAATFV